MHWQQPGHGEDAHTPRAMRCASEQKHKILCYHIGGIFRPSRDCFEIAHPMVENAILVEVECEVVCAQLHLIHAYVRAQHGQHGWLLVSTKR